MSIQLRLIVAAVTTAAAVLAMGQASARNYGHGNGYSHTRTVRCESNGSHRRFCRVGMYVGNARIARQRSHTRCIEGRNWGFNHRGVWVSNGCRADFVIRGSNYRHNDYTDRGYYNHGDGNRGYNDRGVDTRYPVSTTTTTVSNSGQVVQCDSTGNGRTYCHVEPNHRFMLHRSRAGSCVEGQTWGMDDRGLWVSGDCRGDFNYQR